MAIRTEQVSLDIRPCCDAVAPTVCARQGDEGMQLAVTVTDHGRPMQLAGLTATLKGEVPGYAEQAGAVDGSVATFSLGSEWTAHVGIHRPYVELRQGQSVVASTQCALLKVAPGADASAGDAKEFSSFVDQIKSDYEAGISQAEQSFDASIAQMKAKSQEELQQVSSQWDATMSGLQDEAEQLIEDLGQVAEDHGMPLYVYDSVDDAPTGAKCAFFVYDEVTSAWQLWYEDGETQ